MVINCRIKNLLAISLIFLGGCASGNFELSAAAGVSHIKDRAIVVVSAEEISLVDRFPDFTSFLFRHQNGIDAFSTITSVHNNNKNRSVDFISDAYPKSRGRVQVLSIAPGEYELEELKIVNPSGVYYTTQDLGNIKFTARKNKAIYIGNLLIQLESEKLFSWSVDIFVGGSPSIHDRYERDVAIARRNVPLLQNIQIRNEVLGNGEPKIPEGLFTLLTNLPSGSL